MKITYNQILNNKPIPKSRLYLIYGDPYHLINEIESMIKKNLNTQTNINTHYIDNDFSLEEIRNDCESKSLFSSSNAEASTLSVISSSSLILNSLLFVPSSTLLFLLFALKFKR